MRDASDLSDSSAPSVASFVSDASGAEAARARRTLIPLLFVYLLGTVCLQAFNLVFQRIGADLGAPDRASLITAVPGVVLGIACFVYGSLCDFLALRRLAVFGIGLLCAGSVAGFLFHGGIGAVIVCRIVQTIGFQAAGSVYLVIVARYLRAGEKLLYFGMFTAAYQLATAIGVLSGGLVESVDWSLLFLIPLLSVVVLPVLVRYLPGSSDASDVSGAAGAAGAAGGAGPVVASDGGRKDGGVDVPGFTLFGAAVLLLTLFFSMMRWWMVAASVLLFAAFALYISRARDPFITPDFFRNRRWLRSVMLIVVFYFINFSITPLVNDFAGDVYGMNGSQVSFMLLPALLIATVSGVCSGRVSRLLGRERAILLGGSLMCLGMLGCALGLGAGLGTGLEVGLEGGFGAFGTGPVAVGASMCLFYGGMAMLYAPTVDTVLGTLSEEQSGRGVGLNDLAMQGAGAVGIAVFGTPIATRPFGAWSVAGLTGVAANASNLFLIYAAIMLFGVLWFLCFRRSIRGAGAGTPIHSPSGGR